MFEGKYVNILYNYAPIAIDENKLHFMLVPKAHREMFSELSVDEYLEASALEQKLGAYYKRQGYQAAYLFNKTGAEAGQTVPHWHEHVIFTATKVQDLYGACLY
nr:hypothetical protein OJOKFFHK_00028 [uncultured bacterium]